MDLNAIVRVDILKMIFINANSVTNNAKLVNIMIVIVYLVSQIVIRQLIHKILAFVIMVIIQIQMTIVKSVQMNAYCVIIQQATV